MLLSQLSKLWIKTTVLSQYEIDSSFFLFLFVCSIIRANTYPLYGPLVMY